jgi:hypothetical protein
MLERERPLFIPCQQSGQQNNFAKMYPRDIYLRSKIGALAAGLRSPSWEDTREHLLRFAARASAPAGTVLHSVPRLGTATEVHEAAGSRASSRPPGLQAQEHSRSDAPLWHIRTRPCGQAPHFCCGTQHQQRPAICAAGGASPQGMRRGGRAIKYNFVWPSAWLALSVYGFLQILHRHHI